MNKTNDSIMKRKCFVALFDILGLSDLVKNNKLVKVANTYKKAKFDFEDNASYINILMHYYTRTVSFRIFSDTFLMYTDKINDISFLALLTACDFLFLDGNKNKLPIRGATAIGELIVMDGIEIGKPIIDSYENEKRQDWIGCWITKE